MLTHYLGENVVDLKKLAPGTRFNTEDGIRMAREIGAASAASAACLKRGTPRRALASRRPPVSAQSTSDGRYWCRGC